MAGSTLIDMTEWKFGRLTVVERAPNKGKQTQWNCLCICGNNAVVSGANLRRGLQVSCGCFHTELVVARSLIHGERRKGMPSTEAKTLSRIVNRCVNTKCPRYADYGGRGIFVCDRWRHGEDGLTGLECFILDMGRRPGPEMQVERINNDGPYSPSNCRWASRHEQARNTRANRWLEFNGTMMIMQDWLKATGIPSTTFYRATKSGLTPEQIIQDARFGRRRKSHQPAV